MGKQNKKVLFLGDSITVGALATEQEKQYTQIFQKMTGADVEVYGVCGTRIARQSKPSYDPSFDKDFIQRVEEMSPNADVIFVFGGTNDFGHGDAPIGTISDRTEYTFYGALHVLYTKLIKKYPHAHIFIITPLHREGEDSPLNEWGLPCKPLQEYVNAIRIVAEYYALPVIDLWKDSGMQPNIPEIKENKNIYSTPYKTVLLKRTPKKGI